MMLGKAEIHSEILALLVSVPLTIPTHSLGEVKGQMLMVIEMCILYKFKWFIYI